MSDSKAIVATGVTEALTHVSQGAFSVDEFCKLHGNITRQHFYRLLKRGLGPRVFKAGKRTLISVKSAGEWIEKHETLTDQEFLNKGRA